LRAEIFCKHLFGRKGYVLIYSIAEASGIEGFGAGFGCGLKFSANTFSDERVMRLFIRWLKLVAIEDFVLALVAG
jgi:hypothetical protein